MGCAPPSAGRHLYSASGSRGDAVQIGPTGTSGVGCGCAGAPQPHSGPTPPRSRTCGASVRGRGKGCLPTWAESFQSGVVDEHAHVRWRARQYTTPPFPHHGLHLLPRLLSLDMLDLPGPSRAGPCRGAQASPAPFSFPLQAPPYDGTCSSSCSSSNLPWPTSCFRTRRYLYAANHLDSVPYFTDLCERSRLCAHETSPMGWHDMLTLLISGFTDILDTGRCRACEWPATLTVAPLLRRAGARVISRAWCRAS
jgi:hypothetical protein